MMEHNNNKVKLTGVITEELVLSHESFKEKFYKTFIKVRRFSENYDILPVVLSEMFVDEDDMSEFVGERVEIVGSFRSQNVDGKLKLYVFVDMIKFTDVSKSDINNIELTGVYICKAPNYRETPKGRKICDLIVAVNRVGGKSSYIPTITWGRHAQTSAKLRVGDKVKLSGRIQSREYTKVYQDGSSEIKTAYELSCDFITKMKKEEEKESE